MAGVFEITDTTVLKILVRRGTESERQNVRLDEGELGYTIDSKRLFIGDGLGGGGNVSGILYHGAFPNVDTVINSLPVGYFQFGDLFYDTNESTLYALGETNLASSKFDVGPRYEDLVLEKTTSPTGKVRISERVFGKSTIGATTYRKAFFFDYDNNEPFYNTNKVVDFNTNYWAITSKSNFLPTNYDGVFYFGDIKSAGTKQNLDYRININSTGLTTAGGYVGALAVYSATNDIFVVRAEGDFGNSTGISHVLGLSGIRFYPGQPDKNSPSSFLLTQSGTAYFQKTGGTAFEPAFLVDGFARFTNNVMIDNDCLVLGNLTALGDFTVLETFVTISSALSVINSTQQDAMTIVQQTDNFNTARFTQDNIPYSRIIFDRYCRASFGNGLGEQQRGSTVGITGALSSVHVAGGIILRDPRTTEGGGDGRLDVDMNGDCILRTGSNWLDGLNFGTTITKNRSSPTYPTDQVVQIYDDVSNCALKLVANTNLSPALVVGSTGTGSSQPLISLRTTAIGSTFGAGTQVGYFNASGYFQIGNGNGGNVLGNFRVDGACQVTGDVIAYYSSDVNLKNNISTIENPLEKIDKINGVQFDWKENYIHSGHDVGIIAQEVEQILPEAVTTRNDGIKAVRYEKLIPLLIECIKDLKKKIKE